MLENMLLFKVNNSYIFFTNTNDSYYLLQIFKVFNCCNIILSSLLFYWNGTHFRSLW